MYRNIIVKWVLQIVWFLFIVLTFSSCLMVKPLKVPESNINTSVSRVYRTNYETVWKALMVVFDGGYPIAEADGEKGHLKTEVLSGETIFKSPFSVPSHLEDSKYTLTVRVQKGNHSRTLVSVTKDIYYRKFLKKTKRLPSNGLEEQTILYRILKEIQLDVLISQLMKKKSS